MILHTIINEFDVFYSPINQRQYRNNKGIIFEGEETQNGLKVERIISTNPADYLKHTNYIGQYLK